MNVSIRRLSGIVALGLLTSVRSPIPAGPEELERLEQAFTEAWLHGDKQRSGEQLVALEAFVEEHPDSARAQYLLGLATLWSVLRTNAAPENRTLERTLAQLDRAEQALARAHELDSMEADAGATLAFCILQRFMLGKATPDQGPLMGTWLAKAREGSTGDSQPASVRVMSLWLATGQNMNTPEQIDAAMDRFTELGRALSEEVEPDFWTVFGQVLAARALIFSPRPRPLEAGLLTEALLDKYPHFPAAKRFLLPFVTAHSPLEDGWGELDWIVLAEELEPDGGMAGLADGVAVSYAFEEKTAMLWIRVHLTDAPDVERFGMNLVVDRDGSQATGSAWWGGTSPFTFDRLVSAWVAHDEDGKYRGAVGVTDDEGAYHGEMTNLGSVGTAFGIDSEEQALLLRVPWNALTDVDTLRFLVAVGSNAQWNDNLPDEGSFTIQR